MIQCKCEKCGNEFEAHDAAAGHEVICTACGVPVVIPENRPEPTPFQTDDSKTSEASPPPIPTGKAAKTAENTYSEPSTSSCIRDCFLILIGLLLIEFAILKLWPPDYGSYEIIPINFAEEVAAASGLPIMVSVIPLLIAFSRRPFWRSFRKWLLYIGIPLTALYLYGSV